MQTAAATHLCTVPARHGTAVVMANLNLWDRAQVRQLKKELVFLVALKIVLGVLQLELQGTIEADGVSEGL